MVGDESGLRAVCMGWRALHVDDDSDAGRVARSYVKAQLFPARVRREELDALRRRDLN